MVSDTQAVPTLFIYHPWHIDLMVAESLLSSGLLKHVPVNKKERRKKKKKKKKEEERQRNDIPHSFKEAFQKTPRTL